MQVVDGEGESQDMTVAFADNLLLITSATNSEGVVQPIAAGGLVTLINTDEVVSELFLASQDFTAGNIAAMETAISFAGGEDVVPVVPAVVAAVGDEYEIIA